MLGARWHGWARTTGAEGDSHGVGELVDALLDLDAGLHVEGEVLGIGANLDGDAAGSRDAGDARGHLGALDGLRWKRMEEEKSAAALLFFREPPVARERARDERRRLLEGRARRG